MDQVLGALFSDFYKFGSKIQNPVILFSSSTILFIAIFLFLCLAQKNIASHVIGAMTLVISLTLAFNGRGGPPGDDPTVDGANRLGSVIANYMLTVARFLVLLGMFYYVVKIAGLVIDAMQKHMVNEAYWAHINNWKVWVPFFICTCVAFLPFRFCIRLVTKLGVSNEQESFMMGQIIKSAKHRNAFINKKVEEALAKNKDEFIRKFEILGNLKSFTTYVADKLHLSESLKNKAQDLILANQVQVGDEAAKRQLASQELNQYLTNPEPKFILFSELYQNWINRVQAAFSQHLHIFFGLMDVTNISTWPVHGIAIASGFVAVLIIYCLFNGDIQDASSLVQYTNEFAFAAVLTVYLGHYLIKLYTR